MKKRKLLMLFAVVFLSPSIVFAGLADSSYVGTSTTVFTRNPLTGEIVSEKGSATSIGPFQRAPASTGSAPANPAPPSECAIARKRIDGDHQLIKNIEEKTHSGDANG